MWKSMANNGNATQYKFKAMQTVHVVKLSGNTKDFS